MARILLLTPKRRFIANRFGLGYQIPLGLIQIGGALLDHGHQVRLLDNDVYGWKSRRLAALTARFATDYLLIGHTGSLAAHSVCIETARQLKARLGKIRIVYGGVYPTYAHQEIIARHQEIDVIVRGEGEHTTLRLIEQWEKDENLSHLPGITWRNNGRVQANPPALPISDLDSYRTGWELVDWPRYQLFNSGRSAGIQFSRGCPNACSFCGQWMFWRKWRHLSPQRLVADLTILARNYQVKIVWLADENFTADRRVVQEVLTRLISADLGLTININATATGIVRDADLLPLYQKAGIRYVAMGVESLVDSVVGAIGKDNPYRVSHEAVRLLRAHGIISLVNIIYGLEQENIGTLISKFRSLCQLDADILNAVYLTPLPWTKIGRSITAAEIIQPDFCFWTYRNQVVRADNLTPTALFCGVKITEALFHLRPKALLRLFFTRERRAGKILWASLLVGIGVVLAEIWEFFTSIRRYLGVGKK